MSPALRKVTRTRDRWLKTCAEANAAYVDAIRAARDAGHTMPEIGQAAGISKQAVLYHLNGRTNEPS
jgi:predicted transcriptional regulator